MSVTLLQGPPVSGPNGMSKEAATEALQRHPQFPKEADFTIQAMNGNWVAAYSPKVAEFPPSSDEEESAPPKAEGGDDEGAGTPPSDGGSDKPDDGGDSDGPPHKDKGEGKDKGGMHLVEQKLDALLTALGIDPTTIGADPLGGDPSMVPGADPMGPGPDAGPPAPPMGPGAGAPPPHAGPPMPPHGAKEQTTVHQRAMKPGETPPGGTPLGAPAFSSVRSDHPWAHTVGVVPHFRVAEEIGDRDIVEVEKELQTIASAGGFKVSSFTPFKDENDKRHVTAVITPPRPPASS